MQIVIGIFHIGTETIISPKFLVAGLQKEILVPLSVLRTVLVRQTADYGAWQSAPRIIIIRMGGETFIEAGCLKTIEGDVGIASSARRFL